MLNCSIQFEIPEVFYNVKKQSICKLCKPFQYVRDCISHVMDIHLSDVFQTLDQNKFAQDQICCLKQFENGLKCFVFHFAENHGPVGFETNGDFCFMVTKMPGDPNFQTPFNQPSKTYLTIPKGSYKKMLSEKLIKSFCQKTKEVLKRYKKDVFSNQSTELSRVPRMCFREIQRYVYDFETEFYTDRSLEAVKMTMKRIDDGMRHIEKYVKNRKEMEKRISQGRYELIDSRDPEDTRFFVTCKILRFDGIDYETKIYGDFKSYSEYNSRNL